MDSMNAMLWPMIAHAALVFGLYYLLSKRRFDAVRSGSATAQQFKENREEPPESLLVHNNIRNQFELPVLFHAVCLALYVTTADNIGTVVLAWIFVAARYAHSFVHITSNRLRYRRPIWMVSFFTLMAMWLWLATWLVLE